MLAPSFQINLRKQILPGLVTAGKYDGQHTSLTFATAGSRVFIHAPHMVDQTGEGFVIINLQQEVTALGVLTGWSKNAEMSGGEKEELKRDVLVVGMRNSLLVYDVHENTDLFQIEVRDGVYSLAIGMFPPYSTPLIFVGGECAVHGFDPHGNDVYWAVAGDRVTKLGLTGEGKLLVCSEDGMLWVYEGDDVVQQLEMDDTGNLGTEDRMVGICAIAKHDDRNQGKGKKKDQDTLIAVAYGDTLFVFLAGQVLWKAVVGNGVHSIAGCDINEGGQVELVLVYSDGKLEVRDCITGRVSYTMPSAFGDDRRLSGEKLAGMVHASFRDNKVMDIVLCSTFGEVRGFSSIPQHEMDATALLIIQENTLRQLNEEKEHLLQILRYQAPVIAQGDIRKSTENEVLLPLFKCKVEQNLDNKNGSPFNVIVQLKKVPPDTDWELRMVTLFGNGNLDDENGCIVVHSKPSDHARTMILPLNYNKIVPVDLQMRIVYGSRIRSQLLAAEATISLPRYGIFRQVEEQTFVSDSWVEFKIDPLMCVQVYDWVLSRFMCKSEFKLSHHAQMELYALSLINQLPLEIRLDNGEISIRTDDITLAGDIVQDLCGFLNLSGLDVTAIYPKEVDALRTSIEAAKELQIVRTKMQSENADRVILLKEQVLRAEDQRLLDDITGMRESYTMIYGTNCDFTIEHAKRCKTQQQLTGELVGVNRFIQKAANLRVGKAKSLYLSGCRGVLTSGELSRLSL